MLPARPLWGRDDALVLHTAGAVALNPAAVEVAASALVSLGISARVSSAYRAPSVTLSLGRIVTDTVSVEASTSTSLGLSARVEAATSTAALATLVIVPGAATTAAVVVGPQVGYGIPSALVQVRAEVIDPSLVYRGRYRLAGTIRLVRPVTGTLSARPRV